MPRKRTIDERLKESSEQNGDCLIWRLGLSVMGYGLMKIGKTTRYAHRIAYETWVGPIPKGMWVLHKCDNQPCINPKHLFLGTHRENMEDMAAKGRATSGLEQINAMRPERVRGERNPRAKLTWIQVEAIRRRYKRGKVSAMSLANEYGVDEAQVLRVIHYKTWRPTASEILDEFGLYQMEVE